MVLVKVFFPSPKHLDTANLYTSIQCGHWISVLVMPTLLCPNDFIYSRRESSANKQDWSCNYRLKYSNMQLDYENKQLYQQDRQSN